MKNLYVYWDIVGFKDLYVYFLLFNFDPDREFSFSFAFFWSLTGNFLFLFLSSDLWPSTFFFFCFLPTFDRGLSFSFAFEADLQSQVMTYLWFEIRMKHLPVWDLYTLSNFLLFQLDPMFLLNAHLETKCLYPKSHLRLWENSIGMLSFPNGHIIFLQKCMWLWSVGGLFLC